MKDSYNKTIELRCITCGETDLNYNENKTIIKCNNCKKEYLGGSDELIELNQELINSELENSQKEILDDFDKDLKEIKKTLIKKLWKQLV